jgi:rhodanese-related sulfurtransferase
MFVSIFFVSFQPVNGQQIAGLECGVYAMSAAAVALNEPINLTLIETGQFVGPEGSSVAQLREMAAKLGLWSRSLQGSSLEFVRHSTCPVILNLRRDITSESGGHWVTYLGDDTGKAIIFDSVSPDGLRRISYGELALMMTGEVVMVNRVAPSWIEWLDHYVGAIIGVWLWLGGGFIVIGVLWVLQTYRFSNTLDKWWKHKFVVQYLSILLAGFTCGLAADRCSAIGFGLNPHVTAWVQSIHCRGSFRIVTYHQVVQMLHNPEICLIDARPKSHFNRGHLPGSLNFPIDSRPEDFEAFLPLVSEKKALFVYCAGPKCEWDTIIACRLRASGFSDIRIYEEGLQGFIARESQTKGAQ